MGASCTKAGREEAAFIKAAKDGDCRVVQQAITQDIEWAYKVQTWNGQTVFHLAARYGRLDVLETVAEAVRFNPAGPEKWSKLLRMGHSTDAILGAFVNQQDARCQSPLHLACIYGHADVAQRLLELGSTPWTWDELGGRTPLHYASSMGHVDVIRVVLSHNTQQPVGDALRRPNTNRTRLVDICNDSGYTPLHYAVWAGNVSSVRALISYEASLSARNVACGSDWVVSCLKCTPLHLGAHKGNEEICRILLSAYVQTMPPQGADAAPVTDRRRRDPRRHVNANRQLPYHMAVARNFSSLAEILHPDVPFSFILTPAEMEVRMYGVPKLAVIAAKALQAKLLTDIDTAVTTMTSTTARSGVSGLLASGRTRSGGVSALSGAMAAAAAAGQTGGAAAAQQVLAAATARLRAAGERSLGGAPGGAAAAAAAALQGLDSSSGLTSAAVGDVPSLRNALRLHTQHYNQSFEAARAGTTGRASVDSTASAPAGVTLPPAAVVAAAAAAAAAAATTQATATAAGKACAPASNGSSGTSGGEPEHLAVAPVDLAKRSKPSDNFARTTNPPEGQVKVPLPLPPAPISPFLGQRASASAIPPVAAARPRNFNDAASAFARFAAEPFDEPAPAAGPATISNRTGGGAGGRAPLKDLHANSISLAVLQHNRELQEAAAAAAAGCPPSPGAASVSIATLSRRRIPPTGGTVSGAGLPSGKMNPARLRKLLMGRRRSAKPRGGANSQRPTSASRADDQSVRSDLSVDDDLDDILNSMRPNDDNNAEPPRPAVGSDTGYYQPTSRISTPVLPTVAPPPPAPTPAQVPAQGPPPPALQQQSSKRRPSGVGPLNFWRRTSVGLNIPTTPRGAATEGGTPRGGRGNNTPRLRTAGSGGVPPPPLPAGVLETRVSFEAPCEQQGSDALNLAPDPDFSVNPRLHRNSISLAVLARGGHAVGDEVNQSAHNGIPAEPPVNDSAVLTMLASLVEAPQHVLRRYRLLQLTHGLDLHDLLQNHSDHHSAVVSGTTPFAANIGAAAATLGRSDGGLLDPRVQSETTAPGTDATTPVGAPSEGDVPSTARAASGGCENISPFAAVANNTAARPSQTSAFVSPFANADAGTPGAASRPATANAPNTPIAMRPVTAGGLGTPGGSARPLSAGVPFTSGGARPLTGGGMAVSGSNTGASPATGAGANANLAGHLLRQLSSQVASESGEGICGVCFDLPDDLKVLRCGHRLCADCSRELCKLNTLFKPAMCPFCRGLIGGFKYAPR